MGARPTQSRVVAGLPGLYFVENGWSIKKVQRLILLSNTYQESSDFNAKAAEVDPDNKLHWRYQRHRLEGEAHPRFHAPNQRTAESRDGRPGRLPRRFPKGC